MNEAVDLTNEEAIRLAGQLYGRILSRNADEEGFQHYYKELFDGNINLSDAVKALYTSEEFFEKFVYNQTPNELVRYLILAFFRTAELDGDTFVKLRSLYAKSGLETVIRRLLADRRCAYIDRDLIVPRYTEGD